MSNCAELQKIEERLSQVELKLRSLEFLPQICTLNNESMIKLCEAINAIRLQQRDLNLIVQNKLDARDLDWRIALWLNNLN